MGMTFEICNEGEIYMICQGSGGGYGDVLERDPELVMKDLREDLMSHENAHDIYKVVYDQVNLVIDDLVDRSEEHTSELQSLMRISYAVFCLKKKNASRGVQVSNV